ncbi:MAG: type II toxin-antitoxin system VapC family toxin [Ardenticatenaceae bacterium]|nr:type II toxin-antitoxin system VapC family toxin [Ardenticatenaceae bacterium]HBY97219.1 PIN domain nuclease [Chloroflexota bacterium]
MPDIVTDTHGLIWYLENSSHLGPAASDAFDACDRGEIRVYIPTICLVEIVYLQEKQRIPADLKARLDAELRATSTGLVIAPLTAEVADAVARVLRVDVPDMPDRIIVATALQLGLPLISRDRKIQQAGIQTIW